MNKGLKIVLWIIVSFSIIGISGVYLGKGLYNLLEGIDESFEYEDFEDIEDFKLYGNNTLFVNLESANLNIKIGGRKIRVDSDNPYIVSYTLEDGIYISEYDGLDKDNRDYTVNVTIPKNVYFESAFIDNGTGNINIESLWTDYLSLNLDVGEVTFDYLTVTDEAFIEGYFSNLNISSGFINDLDYDVENGNVSIDAMIEGINKIYLDSGKLLLNLRGTKDDYKFNVYNLEGRVLLEGEELSSGTTGNGSNIVYISTESANVDIKVLEVEKEMENNVGSDV